MKGYKMMESNMTCMGFQYEIGKEYTLEDEMKICYNGFHFCKNPFDCLCYYNNIKGDKRLFLVEALGKVITGVNKSVTNKIKIIEEIKDIEKFFDDYVSKSDCITKHNWGCISEYQKLSESFIEKYSDKLNWDYISKHQTLSEEFIEKYNDKVNWWNISKHQKLSEKFIEKHYDKVCWDYVSIYQTLSEEFIEKHNDKVDWDYISQYQTLSEGFIKKHCDEVDWYRISKYQILSEEFIEKHMGKI
jgi:hypothetical protein